MMVCSEIFILLDMNQTVGDNRESSIQFKFMTFYIISLETSIILTTHTEYLMWEEPKDVEISVSYPVSTALNKEEIEDKSEVSGSFHVSYVEIIVYQVNKKMRNETK